MANKEIPSHIKSLVRYRQRVTEDPLRLEILAAHALIEELIELVIAEAVPHSEVFEVPKMQFWRKLQIIRALVPKEEREANDAFALVWKCIEKLTKLRNAAAHRNYDELRENLFTDLAEFFYPDPAFRVARDRDTLLEEMTETCAGFLMGMQESFRHLRQRSQEAKDA
jgi:hypothetical protein